MQGVSFWLLCDAVDEWTEQLCDAEFVIGGAGARLIGGVPELQRKARAKGWRVSGGSGAARCPEHARRRVRRVQAAPEAVSDDPASEQLELELSDAPEPEAAPADAWLTTDDVARWAGVSRKTVLRWRIAHELPEPDRRAGRTGTAYEWRASTIDEWFKSRLHEVTK